MCKKRFVCLLWLMVCLQPIVAQKKSEKIAPNVGVNSKGSLASSALPIRRVVLYSNGVAHVERRGFVSGDAEISLSFKQSQVDDVLKSMLVIDLGQGQIGAVSYNSSAPISAKMAEIPFSVDAETGSATGIIGVLAQLQGAKVVVNSAKGTASGSILTVEKRQVIIETTKPMVTKTFLVIASESGEISSFDLDEVRSVKLLDEGTRRDINEFADATASARRRDAKTITITSDGTGQREMIVSYTISAPIWKTTYRVVLDEAGKPFFQGWAIVDNVSDQDWNNVQLSLVSGAPISFIQQLQKPFYRYRPIIPIPQDMQAQPQIYESQSGNFIDASSSISGNVVDSNGAVIPNAIITIANDSTGQRFSLSTDSDGDFSKSGLPSGNYLVTINASGFRQTVIRDVRLGSNLRIPLEVGDVSATVNVTARNIESLPSSGTNYSSLLRLQQGVSTGKSNSFVNAGIETSVSDSLVGGNSGVTAAATGQEIGDLFEYRIERPVTVLRDRSALIPIIQTNMDGERVSVYNEAVRQDRPLSGVLLKNTSDLTFESGSLTVIDENSYAGEALMERLKPKEQRLISFALDLGTHIQVRNIQDREPAKIIKVVDGVFQIHYFRTSEKLFHLTNQTPRAKTLYIEYPIQDGWTLSEDSPRPDFTTQRYYRFRYELKGLEEKELKIAVRQPLMDSYQLTSLSSTDLQFFVSQRYVNEATRVKLEKLIELRAKINEIEGKLNSFDSEVEKIEADQKRLRENIEALSKTTEAKTLIARYIAKAGEQETRIEDMEKQRKTLETEQEKLESELAREIRAFTITN